MTRIISVTGRICSGKGSLSKAIAANSSTLLAYGDEVRKYIVGTLQRNPTRELLQYWGDQARTTYGKDFWDRKLLAQINGQTDYVIDGFRYPDQVEFFRGRFSNSFKLVVVEADELRRYDWCRKRKREGDPETFDDFRLADRKDWNGYLNGNGQNVEGCFKLADITVNNSGDLEELRQKAVKLLE